MTLTLPIPHEQRKIDKLLIALAKKQPVSAKPAPIAYGQFCNRDRQPTSLLLDIA